MTDLKQLEKEVGAIFIAAGFRVQHHTNLKNTPIDVLAEIDLPRVQKDFRVICKFKYEDSEEAVRELIMTWRNNNKEIKADKIIIILNGIEVLGEDRAMCAQDNIIIWEEDEVNDYLSCFRKDKINGAKKLMGELGLSSYSDPDRNYVPLRHD